MTRDLDPDANLDRCISALERSEDPALQWLSQGLLEYRRLDGAARLCSLLGLRRRGKRCRKTEEALFLRDLWLRETVGHFRNEDGRPLRTSEVALRLSESCRRFETRVWPRVREADPLRPAPERLSNLDRLLWRARQFGVIDLTARRLTDILERK